MADQKSVPHNLVADDGQDACPILVVAEDGLEETLQGMTEDQRRWVSANNFKAKAGRHLLVPGADGSLCAVLYGAPSQDPFAAFEPAGLRKALPQGLYRFAGAPLADPDITALGWALDGYAYTGFSKAPEPDASLAVSSGIADIEIVHDAVTLARDLINTPANVLGPAELADAARGLAENFGATFKVTVGGQLLEDNFPLIHAVGAASDREPRLIDFTWGDESHPKVTLVGKGVCFDSGGLNIKPGSSMELMKKDMGGSANVLALAHMIMASSLKVRLRVLIPAVENAISGNAFRPGDVFISRKGISVEIGNTDAEGRLVLADALALADDEEPDLLIDMATLTGAARVATGADLAPIFTNDDTFAGAVAEAGLAVCDPVWRMPLWKPYDKLLSSKVADVNHISGGPFAGSVTAALFLQRFVEKAGTWAHFDIYAWSRETRPGRPQGGAVQGARALFQAIKARYA